MTMFGPLVHFSPPSLADAKQQLLLVVEGVEVRLDASELDADVLPRYRDMLQRLARDPVGHTLVLEFVMRLFFIHVLGLRPECMQNRGRPQAVPRVNGAPMELRPSPPRPASWARDSPSAGRSRRKAEAHYTATSWYGSSP